MRVTSFETPQVQFVSWLMGKVFHVQSIFEENGDIDEVGCIDVVRSGGTWLCDGCAESCTEPEAVGSKMGRGKATLGVSSALHRIPAAHRVLRRKRGGDLR